VRRRWVGSVLAAACVFGIGGARAADDAFAPTVSRREADVLARVTALAATNTAAARTVLRDARTETSSPALDFAMGNLLLQDDELPAAAEAYRRALVKMPAFRRARINLGRVYLLQDQPAETIELYRELVRQGPADADTLRLLGHAFVLQQKAVSAETAYRQALLLQPEDTDARLGLTKALLEQERHREALALLDELLAREPRRRDLWALRANLHLAADQPERALVACEAARRLGLADAGMLGLLGDLYMNAGQPEEAGEVYAAACDPAAPPARLLRAAEAMLAAGQLEPGRRLLAKAGSAFEAAPEDFSAAQRQRLLRLRGRLARREGDLDEARGFFAQALRSDPLDGDALLLLADVSRQQGDLDTAVLEYERAARLPGYEARALVRHAQLEVERGRYAEAVPLLEAAQAFEKQAHVARYLDQVRRMAER